MFARRAVVVGLLALGPSILSFNPDPEHIIFRRGDANLDGVVNDSDAIFINNFLFLGGPTPGCMNQADVNNDGLVNVSDPVYLLSWRYSGGPAPPYPGAYNSVCTTDDSPSPGCSMDPCP